MTRQEFVQAVGDGVQKYEYDIKVRPVYKGTRELTGVTFSKENANISPTVYLESVEDKIGEMDFDDVLDTLLKIVEKSLAEPGQIDIESLAKSGELIICACSLAADKFLENVPHRKVGETDTALYCRVAITFPFSDEGAGTFVVNDGVMNILGMTEDELFKNAIENTRLTVMDMNCVLREMGMPVPEDERSPFCVASNPKRYYGAGIALADTSYLREHGKDMYIIPSSVHEVLYLDTDDELNASVLRGMVQDVNSGTVAEEDRLSYNVLYYHADTDSISLAG